MSKRIFPHECCGVIIDVQEFFLSQVDQHARCTIVTNTRSFARVLGYLRIPIVVTLERPVEQKGSLPKEIREHLRDRVDIFEKNFFDLTREEPIREHLARLGKKQVMVAGCETDVCVLQSCLGLLDLGYEVYVVEDLLFSSSRNVAAALARMKAQGAVFLTYKSLYYELIAAADGGLHAERMRAELGQMPDDLSSDELRSEYGEQCPKQGGQRRASALKGGKRARTRWWSM
ncbi:MAG TPA: isochorismatase family protein [Xanthobacteraceae bacterium]|jgi:nicotinamidase-related amidase